MSVYTNSIVVAAIFTVIMSFILFIPWLIYTYRKYGFLSFSKTIVVFSFLFYAASALCLILLPLPPTRDTCAIQPPDTVHYNLQLFQFIKDIQYKSGIVWSQPSTWRYILQQPAFFQAFFNFLLLMPLGVYLRYFWQKRKYAVGALITGFIVSLFFEITQYTGVYGIYNCAYRLFDVDDLLLNSSGAFIGYLLAPIVLLVFPSHKDVAEKASLLQEQNVVRPAILLLALFIDYMVVMLSSGLLNAIVPNHDFIATTVAILVVFGIVPMLTKGATIGMLILNIRVVNQTGSITVANILRRFLAAYVTYLIFKGFSYLNQVMLPMESPFYKALIFLSVGSFALSFILSLALFIHFIRLLLGGGQRQLYLDKYAKLYPTRRKNRGK